VRSSVVGARTPNGYGGQPARQIDAYTGLERKLFIRRLPPGEQRVGFEWDEKLAGDLGRFVLLDQNNEAAAYLGNVSITGLLLAGFVTGSLGVLNDVTVRQASTVFELAELEGSSRRAIFLGAMRVGRDHIASTVYTLVLAFAGSALPLLLMFSVANRSLGDVLTSESVAIEIARSGVGGIALALSVP
jgi:hypothetical protein